VIFVNERIKNVRNTLKLTQQEFADRIGCSRSGFANYESGRNEPINPVISAICREFNVSETWLRTGEGDMFIPISRDLEIAAFMGDVMKGEKPDFRRRLIAVLAKLDSEEWELLERMAQKLAAESKEDQT
jgi:transcriptional regulator with XRE-family HTH domain